MLNGATKRSMTASESNDLRRKNDLTGQAEEISQNMDEATAEETRSTAEPGNEVDEATAERLRREREARAHALTLEIVGDLPFAEVKPPENILFVCKLNPVTQDEELNLIFSRFGKILSCEVIRDKRTGDSLQYAFIEFDNQKDCEQAYLKMHNVLIDDHRIHVDFSQSVSKLSDIWRKSTNSKRAKESGGFGGVSSLEKRRQYRASESGPRSRGYGMVFDKGDMRHNRGRDEKSASRQSRSRSPKGKNGLAIDESRRQSPRRRDRSLPERSRSRSPRRKDRYSSERWRREDSMERAGNGGSRRDDRFVERRRR